MSQWQPPDPSQPQQPQQSQPPQSPYQPYQQPSQPSQPPYQPQQPYPTQPQVPQQPPAGQPYAQPPTGPAQPGYPQGPQAYPGYPASQPGYQQSQAPQQAGYSGYPSPSAPTYGGPSAQQPGYPPAGQPYAPNTAQYPQQAFPQQPQQPQQPPSQPPKRRGALGWILGGVSALVVLAVVAGVLALALSHGALGKTALKSTATATPAPLATATYGGTINGFKAQYGAPQSLGAKTAIYNLTLQGQQLTLLMTLDIGLDQQPHVSTMILAPSNANINDPSKSTWTVTAATATVQALLPADAQVSQDNSSSLSPIARVYSSVSLAHTFSASLFVDLANNPVTAGSFTVACIAASSSDTQHVTTCLFALGHS